MFYFSPNLMFPNKFDISFLNVFKGPYEIMKI